MFEISFFYFGLFLAVVGTFSVIGFLVRRTFLNDDEIVFRHVRHTFRQSILLAVLIIAVLILLSKQLLFWWNLTILVALFIFLEAIFFSNRRHNNF